MARQRCYIRGNYERIVERQANTWNHSNRTISRASGVLRWGLITVAAAAGCCAFSVLPYRSNNFYSTTTTTTTTTAVRATRLVDILPSDLDDLLMMNDDNKNFHHERVIKALGVQLLLFAGWTRSTQQEGGLKWQRDKTAKLPLSLQDRLERITPTFKAGGQLDYTFDDAPAEGIFGDNTGISNNTTTTSVANLANHLEEEIGLSAEDFDVPARIALQAMLSWRIHVPTPPIQRNRSTVLLIFSFDATPNCRSVDDCPLPGPSNELLAATAAKFVQDDKNNVDILAQWEVAAALQHNYGVNATAVGTPGTFQNTAEIFQLMLCAWNDNLIVHNDNNEGDGSDDNRNDWQAILLAHPDHLRRVLWTSQTILSQQQQQEQNQHKHLRADQHDPHKDDDCAVPPNVKIQLIPAMNSYRLDWPNQQQSSPSFFNLFGSITSTVHTKGQELVTSWYDHERWGFFPDADPQAWTHRREIWLLYDQWAVAKGIVTGTIDPNLTSTD